MRLAPAFVVALVCTITGCSTSTTSNPPTGRRRC